MSAGNGQNGGTFVPDPRWPSFEELAIKLWGQPNRQLSKPDDMRFGAKGSKSVRLSDLTWFDHQEGVGGGYIDLHLKAIGPLPSRPKPKSKPNCLGGQVPPWENVGVVYHYHDAAGALILDVVRTRTGTPRFLQRRPDGKGKWVWSVKDLPGHDCLLYRLPGLRASGDATVWIAEGEKDADNLHDLGLIATTGIGGAGKWRAEYAEAFRDKRVVVLPDNDPQAVGKDGNPLFHPDGRPVVPGQDHADAVARSLIGVAASVKVLMLPGLPLKGDVSDWLDAGGTVEELERLAREARETDLHGIDLTVLRINRRPASPLPLEVFGPQWAAWITETAEVACCPLDYVAAPLLSISSALIGNARWAQGSHGWAEPPHLWVGSVGDSGDGKSPGADVLLGKIRAVLEHRMIGDFPDRQREWQTHAVQAKVCREQWEADVVKALKAKKAPPVMPADIDPGNEPQEPRLCCQDVTIERVATLLASAAPKGLLMVRDELAGFLLGMTAYSDAARPFWLECYGGRPYSVDRQKHARAIKILHNVVAWFGTIQPERLSELIAEPDDGLLARFLWVWPEPVLFRMIDRAPDIEFAIRSLDRLRMLDMLDFDGRAEPLRVPLCPAAYQRMEAFGQAMQRQKDACAGLLRSACGKARGQALRLSLILEMLWWCGKDGANSPPTTISEAAFEAASRLVKDYLIPMAERTYGNSACSQEDRNTAVLARWLRDATPRPTEVHVRTVQREVRLPGLTKAPEIHAACQSLVDAGWLLPASTGLKLKNVLMAYPVNPGLWGALTSAAS